jgi:hypothetical protein
MKMTIRSVSVLQTAKITAIVYAAFSVIVVPFFMIAIARNPRASMGGIALVAFLPFFYGIAGFLFTVIGCLLYNLLAKHVGGIEFTVEEKP